MQNNTRTISTVLKLEEFKGGGGPPRYEQIAHAICQAIQKRHLKPGDRLPTVRRLAAELEVSLTTVAAAFRWLGENGWTRGETGRGTFVADSGESDAASVAGAPSIARGAPHLRSARRPWRRRTVERLTESLRSTFPHATNCSTGGPGPSLFPFKLIRRHWKSAFDAVTCHDLQYKTADPIDELASVLPPRLSKDGIPVDGADLVVGTSTQQFLVLVPDVVGRLQGAGKAVFAVEHPGYYTIFDAWDRAGVRMIGVETDEEGVRPESLESAISAGTNAVLFTPRALNPTGASWTPARVRALGDVLSRHSHVLAIEDDHFGDLAEGRAGSLLADRRIEERVIYIRSFSKSIAPDLRLAVAAARPRLKSLVQEAKKHADGWSSRLLQRVLARLLQDRELDPWFSRVRRTYRKRREQFASVLANCGVPGVVTWPGRDGVNVWIHLPPEL